MYSSDSGKTLLGITTLFKYKTNSNRIAVFYMSLELIRELQNLQVQEDSLVLQLNQISSTRKGLHQAYRLAKTTVRKKKPKKEQTPPDKILPHKIGDTAFYSNTGKAQVFDKKGTVSVIGQVFVTLTTEYGTKVRRQA